MEVLLQKFQQIGYTPANLENDVERILIAMEIDYLHHPNGKQKSPDFKIKIQETTINLECKSSKVGRPMWNSAIPAADTVYIFTCPKEPVTIFTGDVLVTDEIQQIYSEYKESHKALQHRINNKLKNTPNPANMQVFARNMFVQGSRISALDDRIRKKTDNYLQTKSKSELLKYGQFFTTDTNLLRCLIENVPKNTESILEPSCGFGNVISECVTEFPQAKITGIEISETVANETAEIFRDTKLVKILKDNFLTTTHPKEKDYDLIIGNPPYFHINANEIPEYFNEIIKYRTNIYSLFIYKSIKLLKPGGLLHFVVPKTICSGRYFQSIRNYIYKEACGITIDHFKSNLFKNANQSVVVIKIKRKTKSSDQVTSNFATIMEKDVYFVKSDRDTSTTTLQNLGCKCSGGTVVWNKIQEFLSDTKSQGFYPLVMTRNLVNGSLVWSDHSTKKQYVRLPEEKLVVGPIILVGRIIGYPVKLKVVLYNSVDPVFVENHINIIRGNLQTLEMVYKSLTNKKTIDFLNDFVSSSQLSSRELYRIIPIHNN